MPRSFKPRNIPCLLKGCNQYFTNRGGLTNHVRWHQGELQAQQRRERLQKQEELHEQERCRTNGIIDSSDDPFTGLANLFDAEDGFDQNAPDVDNQDDEPTQPRPQSYPTAGEHIMCHPLINGMLSHKSMIKISNFV